MIDKFENKLNEIKEKIDKKFFGIFLFMVFGAMTMFAMTMLNSFKIEKQAVQDEYNKYMYQVVSYVNNVEVELEKLQITTTDNLKLTTLADIWRQSNLAKSNLEALPVTQDSMQNASKYLTQVSDYSYTLIRKLVNGSSISDKEYDNISNMYENSKEFSKVLSDIYNDLNSGKIKWDELEKIGNERIKETEISAEISNIDKINKTFQEYEGLIYDGAFSDHILTLKPRFLSDNVVDESVARDTINNLFGKNKIENINYLGESNGRIDLYNYNVKLKNEEFTRSISITKKDARLYLMISDREVTEEKISINDAKKSGIKFLNKLGMENLKDTYYLKIGNMAIINYAAIQDDIIIYPDLVKVKVALDTGDILSVEAQGYTFNHRVREDITPSISIEEAKLKINKDINIMSEQLSIIPTDSKNEVLVYEFKGKIEDREFIVYVNARTGLEEKILIILDTPGGILTI